MGERVYVDGRWLLSAEAEALKNRLERELVDDAVVYVGRGKNRDIVHLIAGRSKAQHQPLAVCGQWVSNRKIVPTTERICQKCQRGQRTAFSTFNQPRDCMNCGRKFADSTSRDSNQSLCPNCYDIAGIENEHQDGEHEGRIVGECPMCQDDLADATVTATRIEAPIPAPTSTETETEPAATSTETDDEPTVEPATEPTEDTGFLPSMLAEMRQLSIRRAMRDWSRLSIDLETAERTDRFEAGQGHPERVRTAEQRADDERTLRRVGLTLAKLLLEHHVPDVG